MIAIGDRVRYISIDSEDDKATGFYPPVGTCGIVVDVDEGGLMVKWGNGTKDGEWWCCFDDVEVVPETMYARIKRMTPEEMKEFIYWVYLNGNEDGKTNSCDSPGSYFAEAMLTKSATEVMPNNKVEDLWDDFMARFRKE